VVSAGHLRKIIQTIHRSPPSIELSVGMGTDFLAYVLVLCHTQDGMAQVGNLSNQKRFKLLFGCLTVARKFAIAAGRI
jgi:hypothetical protein